jgi:hypothetical protein
MRQKLDLNGGFENDGETCARDIRACRRRPASYDCGAPWLGSERVGSGDFGTLHLSRPVSGFMSAGECGNGYWLRYGGLRLVSFTLRGPDGRSGVSRGARVPRGIPE